MEEQQDGTSIVYERAGGLITAAGGERLVHDGLESVVARFDGAAVTGQKRFDAWGGYRTDKLDPAACALDPTDPGCAQKWPAPGLGEPEVGYTGYLEDRATRFKGSPGRWQSPELGSFLSLDPDPGSLGTPVSMHPFAYGALNPLSFTDPTGRRFQPREAATGVGMWASSAGRSAANSFLTMLRPGAALVGGTTGSFDKNGNFRLEKTDSWSEEMWNGGARVANVGVNVVTHPVDTVTAVVVHPVQLAGDNAAACWLAVSQDGPLERSESRKCGEMAPGTIMTVADAVAGTHGATMLGRKGVALLERAGGRAAVELAATPRVRYKVGDVLPDGRIAGDGPGAAIRGFRSTERRAPGAALLEAADDPAKLGRSGRNGASADIGGLGPEESAIREVGAREAGAVANPKHHIFPQEHRAFFESRGFTGRRSIDRYTLELEESTHQAIHGGGDWRLGRAWEGEWNNQIMRRIAIKEKVLGRKLGFGETMKTGGRMTREYGLGGINWVQY